MVTNKVYFVLDLYCSTLCISKWKRSESIPPPLTDSTMFVCLYSGRHEIQAEDTRKTFFANYRPSNILEST